jgi:prepilin-type N-terminal cleavage/methylation domain-containing protein
LKKGFTLIELAIVLVVLGIFITAIVGGQNIIESSQRQAIVSDLTKFKTAINAFRLEFDALPGDFDEAEDYFGSSNASNGNGDGMIVDNHPRYENIYIWNHLGEAGIINDTFEKGGQFSYSADEPEKTFPKASMGDVFWGLGLGSGHPSFSNTSIYNLRNVLTLFSIDRENSSYSPNSQNPSVNSIFAYKLDKKIDDGKPFLGNMALIAYEPGSGGGAGAIHGSDRKCHDNQGRTGSIGGIEKEDLVYNLEGDEKYCAPVFVFQKPNKKFSELF